MKNFILLVLSFSFFVSCATTTKSTRPSSKTEAISDFDKMREDFDPLTLNDEDIKFEEAENISPTIEEEILNPDRITLKDSLVTGYRVQLIQTTDPEEAKNVERDAILRFDVDVYRIFDPPFYKVRIGDFINWYDAEELQKLALKKGFKEAWVVRTKVDYKKAMQWLEEFQ